MTIDTGMRRTPRRVTVALGIAAVVSSAILPSTTSALPADPAGPDLAGVELMEDAIDALSSGDDGTYDVLLDQLGDGSVWLPNAAIAALEDRDVDDIVLWSAVIDSTNDELLGDWAYEAIETEREALAVLDNGVPLTVEQTEDIDDADFDGAVVLEIVDHRGVFISEPTRKALTSSLAADGNFPDDIVYERALRDIDARQPGPDGPTTPPPFAEAEPTPGPSATTAVESIEVTNEVGSDAAAAEPDERVEGVEGVEGVETVETAEAQADPPITVVVTEPAEGTSGAESGGSLMMIIAITLAAAALLVGLVTAFRGRKADRLADIAFTDGLTGLSNRRRLDADVAAQRERGYRATSALMIDVDHFKQFNDTHGHDMGDEVLRLVGGVLSREFRKSDVPYRYGGEEFCVLLNDVTTDEAHIAGERLRQAIEAIELPIPERITASIGVSTGPAMELPSTIKRADGALYDAKEAGRNRIADA